MHCINLSNLSGLFLLLLPSMISGAGMAFNPLDRDFIAPSISSSSFLYCL